MADTDVEVENREDDNGEVVEDEVAERFELRRDGAVVSFASYYLDGDTLVVPHVETVMRHRGEGHADRLMAGMLDILRATGRHIRPTCPFAAGHLRDHPDQQDLLG